MDLRFVTQLPLFLNYSTENMSRILTPPFLNRKRGYAKHNITDEIIIRL